MCSAARGGFRGVLSSPCPPYQDNAQYIVRGPHGDSRGREDAAETPAPRGNAPRESNTGARSMQIRLWGEEADKVGGEAALPAAGGGRASSL